MIQPGPEPPAFDRKDLDDGGGADLPGRREHQLRGETQSDSVQAQMAEISLEYQEAAVVLMRI